MTQIQTLSVGNPLATSKYGALGVRGHKAVPPLHACFLALYGEMMSGKSALIQNCPGGYIINFDRSPIVSDASLNHRADIWPWVNEFGETCDAAMKPFNFTIDTVLDKRKVLLEMAADRFPDRPRVVFIDSVAMFFSMAYNYYLAKGPGPTDRGKNFIRRCYGDAYDLILDFQNSLLMAGYGVCFIMQSYWAESKISKSKGSADGEDDLVTIRTFRPNIQPGLLDRFVHNLNFGARLTREIVPVTRKVSGKMKLTDGREIDRGEQTVTDMVAQHFILIEDRELPQGYVKNRLSNKLPAKILLDPQNPWDSLETAYNKARKEMNP